MSDVLKPALRSTFRSGIDDAVILPLVIVAFAVAKLLRGFFNLLVHIIDWLFPILLQIMRFPLFTLRILGDALAWFAKAVVRILPVGGTRRAAWRERISEAWAWLRAKISYKAFEEWLHHAFESGMAWVFKRCRALTPRGALLVLAGAILWLPISFGVATGMHAILFAKALTWPAWTQLLHPLATVIAKSKLLVLPVYPAAWPQAKQHPFVQALTRFWQWLGTLYLVRKTAWRYGQMDNAAVVAGERLAHTSAAIGLTHAGNSVLNAINAGAAVIGRGVRAVLFWFIRLLAAIPLFGGIVRRYEAHYDEVSRHPKPPVSERVKGVYARWSVKFTAEYYEQKEREEAALSHATTQRPTI